MNTIIYQDGSYTIEATGDQYWIHNGSNKGNRGTIAPLRTSHAPDVLRVLTAQDINPTSCVGIQDSSHIIRTTAQEAWKKYVHELAEQKRKKEEAKLQKIPGLKLLERAYNDVEQYQHEFEVMMEDENNDGVNPPVLLLPDIDALKAQYPVASLYLRAEAYRFASNDKKSSAGKKAMAMLEEFGASAMHAALGTLEGWLSYNDRWD